MNSALIFVLILVSIVMTANVIETWLKQKKKAPEIDEDLDDTLAKIDHQGTNIGSLAALNAEG